METVDLSLGGVRIYSAEPMRVGSHVKLDLLVPNLPLAALTAEVTWIEELAAGAPARFEIGLRFVQIDPEAMKVLLHVLGSENSWESAAQVGTPEEPPDVRFVLSRIDAALRIVVSRPASPELNRLTREAQMLRMLVESWRERPPPAPERERIMERVLLLHTAIEELALSDDAADEGGPFAQSPSAPPPASDEALVPVLIPPPGAIPNLAPETASLPMSETPASSKGAFAEEVDTKPDLFAVPSIPPEGQPAAAPLPEKPRRRRSLLALALATTMALSGAATYAWLFHGRHARVAVSAIVNERPTAISTVSTAKPPVAELDAAADAATETSAPTRPFDPAAAREALSALVPKLTDCKLAKGSKGRVKVTFAPNGTVQAAASLAPYAGTRRGACIAAHLQQAQVPAFSGPPASYNYVFLIPR